jgi:glucose/arabinose dehydrogenase
MRATLAAVVALGVSAFPTGCGDRASLPESAGFGPSPTLPPPNPTLIPTVSVAPLKGWPDGMTPRPAPGLKVTAFAEDLDHPRWLHVLPNGDVLAAETNAPPRPEDNKGLKATAKGLIMKRAGLSTPSANRITLLRDADGDGRAEFRSIFLEGLNSPFGMALVGDQLYVANTDAVVRFPYAAGQTRITAPGVMLTDLPGGPLNHHWTKNLIASRDGKRLYVSVGSNSDVAENGIAAEEGRAAIWEIDVASGRKRLFAKGLRNPVGMSWEPVSGALWTAVNERDELGSDLVPDYMTEVTDGAFYGWPYSYYGQHVDTRVEPQRPDLVANARVPDYALGNHTASLGLAFAPPGTWPEPFAAGVFVGQHGSWNRRPLSGYKVIFVPFRNGRPDGPPVDVLTGFLDAGENALGRPVGVVFDRRQGLLVADDVSNRVWRVSPVEPSRAAAAD